MVCDLRRRDLRKNHNGDTKDELMTTTAAENAAGHPVEKEKVEKRRALGRGLESLLPRPRVVGNAVSGGASGLGSGTAGKQQVPHFVRNDHSVPNDNVSSGATAAGTSAAVIQAVAEASADEAAPVAGAEPRSAVSTSPLSPLSSVSPTGERPETITIQAQAESRMPGNLVVHLAISDIDKNPFQTRYISDDEKLDELADSIRANGVVQPIMVRPAEEEGRYILILGERRLHASKKAEKTAIPAIVRRVSEQQAAEMTIVENLQREDLSCLEQAEAFRVLSKQFNMTQQQIGERVGISRESVSNYMRLLRLPPSVMEHMAHKDIGFSEARELLKLDSPELIAKTADYIVQKHMTLDQIETMIMRMTGLLDPVPGLPGQEKKKSGARWVDPNVRAAQTDLERLLGVRVRIRDKKGKGKIVIEYHTVDDYERVVDALRGKK